jgi:transcriptional regulator with XRE-family HTH domain
MTNIHDVEIRTPHLTDVSVGDKVRLARMEAGFSQVRLAELMGISWQQLQKYEYARNRVSSGRLKQIAQFTGKPVSFFFEEAPVHGPVQPLEPALADIIRGLGMPSYKAFMVCMKDDRKRRMLMSMIRTIARSGEEVEEDEKTLPG